LIFISTVILLLFFIWFLWVLGFRNTGIKAGSLAALVQSILVVIVGGSIFAVFQMIGAIGILFFITRKAGRIIFVIIFLLVALCVILNKDFAPTI
jgi:hypothetical protein